ncbi:MAG: DUF4241 domain-containing protein [Propioniciclava sp.]|uniref:DUF4241 domain-containing protein n=1 Tax=Propioniciclava sp. TaxID=2038686 RepID=UPI0039E6CC75
MSADSESRKAAEERVLQFGIEFDAQWRIAAVAFRERDPENPRYRFDLWRELMAQTQRNHCTEASAVDLAQSFSGTPDHGPEAEQLVRSEIDGEVAYVLTRVESPITKFYEYTLHAQGGEWRIAAIAQHFNDPTQPFADRATIEKYLSSCSADAPLEEVPAEQAPLDEVFNFTAREVRRPRDGEIAQTEISQIGTLVTSTGALSVLDFGYDNDDARPLARTVAPGSYPVDRVTGFERNAAIRVRFSDEVPVSWHAASRTGGGHVFGVDAGCACVVDYVAYSEMTPRAKAAVFDQLTAAPLPAVFEFPLGNQNVGVAFDSGYGDGGYPAYWGLDAQSRVAQLVIDFLVLATQDDDGVLTHL